MYSIVFSSVVVGVIAGMFSIQPEASPQELPRPEAPSSSQAIDAILGRSNPNAQEDPTTRVDPGYVTESAQRTADTTYGPTTTSLDADGNTVAGYTPYDAGIEYDTGGVNRTTPEYHTVQKGDTLWGISGYYMRDPYQWPRLWSYNDHVTNAHWIFPGDRVRLSDPYGRADDGTGLGSEETRVKYTRPRLEVSQEKSVYVMNQTTFVDKNEFDSAMTVVGGAEAKVMMSTLDKIYMDYDRSQPPVPGERLVIYTPSEPVRDVDSRQILGYMVEVVGEAEVERVAREAAEGTIALATNPVERGYKVGPLRRRFKRVSERDADATEVGRVVATLVAGGPIEGAGKKKKKGKHRNRAGIKDTIAGEEQFVVMNMGSEDGLKEGNVLEAVRKGDEYSDKHAFEVPYEDGWPRRVIGRVLAIEVQESTSLGVVIWSRRELERGEYVELRAPGMQDKAGAEAAQMSAEREANKRRNKASGRARFKMGTGD